MFALDTSDPCAAGRAGLRRRAGLTGNATIAEIADVVIGKPLALVGLLLLALFARWLLHRLVDRLVNRAEDGVLPDRVTRLSLGRSRRRAPPRRATWW